MDRNNLIQRYNLSLGDKAPSSTRIFDTNYHASHFGLANSQDKKFYFETKNLFSPDFLALISQELSKVLMSFLTPMKKVLVLDLDHILWGGVIGDDGMEGIQLGGTSAKGEAYKDFKGITRHRLPELSDMSW